jgi:hypothetical protein
MADYDAKWFRSWHGAPTDNKFLLIAKRAQVAPGMVSAVYWALLDYASQNEPRGSVEGFDTEIYAEWSKWEERDVIAIIATLIDKKAIINGRIASWEKRQPKREDPGAADRMRKMRDAQRNAVVTRDESVTCDSVTDSYAVLHDVTPSYSRLDKIREEKSTEEEPATASRSQMVRQYEAVLGMLPLASYPEMTQYMDRLISASAADWWALALQETTGARRPGWQYMKSVLEAWLAAGQPSTNSKTNGHSQDADNRPRVKAPPADALAAADARQAAYERQVAEELARAGRLA